MKLKEEPNNEPLSDKTKLLIFEYKERFPCLSPMEIARMFCLEELAVFKCFAQQYIIVESKMNKLKTK